MSAWHSGAALASHDLCYGHALDADWQGRNRFHASPDQRVLLPLSATVACCAEVAQWLRPV